MRTSSVIDWLEITKPDFRCDPAYFMPQGSKGWEIEETLGAHAHYNFTGRCENGAIVMHGKTEKQGMRLIISGQPMAENRRTGGTDIELLKWSLTDGRRPTRIDLTVDMVGNDAPHPKVFQREIEKGNIRTRARSFEQYGKINEEGYTVYVGAPSSDKRMRIYDYRAKHLNPLYEAWTRCELQLRQDVARAASRDLMAFGVRDTACNWCSAFCDFTELPEWAEATDPEVSFAPSQVPRKPTNWEEWVLNSVYKSLAKSLGTSRQGTVLKLVKMLERDGFDFCV